MFTFLLSIAFAFADHYNFYGFDRDNEKTINSVSLISGKKEDTRFYQSQRADIIAAPIKKVIQAITNFEEKCNNDLAQKREYLAKNYRCPFLNTSIIESQVIKETKSTLRSDNILEQYLIKRRIYNRNYYQQIDLFTLSKITDKKMEIKVRMLRDKEIANYLDIDFKTKSAFLNTLSHFILEDLGNETKLTYSYTSFTDHWLINKSMVAHKVFEKMAAGVDRLFSGIKVKINELNNTPRLSATKK